MSGEIVEIGEDSSESAGSHHHHHHQDVYVAVGKNDQHLVQWAIDHFASPRIFLLHIFPPLSYVSTPGMLNREPPRQFPLLSSTFCIQEVFSGSQ